jgi:rare lipoprotein A
VKSNFIIAVTFATAFFVGTTGSQSNAQTQSGIASVYTTKIGTKTASGKRLNDGALTAAHRTLPFGTQVRVTNKRNGRSVVVTITDRGPFIRGRIIDLTMAGANAIGMGFGLAPVTVDRL